MRWFCGWLGFNSIETTVSRQHFDKAEKKFNILGQNCFCFAFDFLSLCVMFYLRYYVHIVHVTVCFSSFATALLLCYWYSCHFLLCIPWNWNDDMRSHRIERTKPIRKQWQLLYGSMIYMLLSCICGCQCKRCNHENSTINTIVLWNFHFHAYFTQTMWFTVVVIYTKILQFIFL